MTAADAAGSPAAIVGTFERGEISTGPFDHAAHVHVGWCYLREFGVLEGTARFAHALRRLTAALGAADKYHETITGFFMLLIAERDALTGGGDWEEFLAGNPDLVEGAATLLRRHYSASRIASALSRRQFLLPDRAGCGVPGTAP